MLGHIIWSLIRVVLSIYFILSMPMFALCSGSDAKLTGKEIKFIDRTIKSKLHYDPRHPGGNIEEEGTRIYLIGDLKQKHDCIAVQFALGAGNADYQYLLIVERNTLKVMSLLRIGGRGFRDITIKKIEDGFICADVIWYGPNDSLPSPSVHGGRDARAAVGIDPQHPVPDPARRIGAGCNLDRHF